jgi:hypothetical protein
MNRILIPARRKSKQYYDKINHMKSFKLLLGTLMLATITIASLAQKQVIFSTSSTALQANKKKVDSKDADILPAYKQLLKDADKALDYQLHSVMEKKNNPPSGNKHDYMSLAPYFWPDPSKPDGLPYIRKDGQTNPEVHDYLDKEYMPKLCENAYTLALAYYFSGEEKYAAQATKLLRVWFLDTATRMNPNLEYGQAIKGVNTGRGTGLIDTRHFIKVVDAIGMLKASKNWTTKDQQGMQQWFAAFLNWMQTSSNGLDELDAPNNHGIWYDAQRMSFAIFVDSTALAKKIVANAITRLDKQMDEMGSLPREMERTIALHYSVFALQAFFYVAQMAETIGVNVWQQTTPSGKSLKKAFDFQKPFISNEKPWTGQQIKPYEWEESYPLLLTAKAKFNCNDCKAAVDKLAGDKQDKIIEKLLY